MDQQATPIEEQEARSVVREYWKAFGIRGAGVLSHPDEVILALQAHPIIVTQTTDGKIANYLVSLNEWQSMNLIPFNNLYNHSVTEWVRSNLFNSVPQKLNPDDACIVGGRKNNTSGFVIIPGNAAQPVLDEIQPRRGEILGVGRTMTQEFHLALDTGKLVFGSRSFPSAMDNKPERIEEFAVAVGASAISLIREGQKQEDQRLEGKKLPIVSMPGTKVETLRDERKQEDLINSAIFSNGIATLCRWFNNRNCGVLTIVAGNDNVLNRLHADADPAEILQVGNP